MKPIRVFFTLISAGGLISADRCIEDNDPNLVVLGIVGGILNTLALVAYTLTRSEKC